MKELTEGVVIEVTEHTAKVRASIHGDCDHCGMCPGSNAMILDVVNEAGAAVGDHVFIENRTMNGVLAAFIIFLLPILAVILGIFPIYAFSKITDDFRRIAFWFNRFYFHQTHR